MIRVWNSDDYHSILGVWRESGARVCPWLTTEAAVEKDLNNAHLVVVYEVDSKVEAFAYIDPPEANGEVVHFFVITNPQFRTTVVLNALWEYLGPYLSKVGATKVDVAFPSEWGLQEFFAQQGFGPKLCSQRMEYYGSAFDKPVLEARPYRSEDFPYVLRTINEGFYELRRQHDLQPYTIYNDEAFNDDNVREKISQQNLTVFVDNGEVVGYLDVSEPALAVGTRFRGKGYGSAIARHCINHQLQQGITPYLYVLDSNTVARAMYEKVGYQSVATIQSMRRYKCK